MKRFLAKIGGFFWSWGFLKFMLWAVTLIALLYAEEDWRGAHDWAQTKAKWEARGESFDFNRLVPPAIPDSENLAAIALFKMEPDPQKKGRLAPLNLIRALRLEPDRPRLSQDVGNWQRGQLPNFQMAAQNVADEYQRVFHAAPAGDALTQLEALYPFLAELRSASITRPLYRFPQSDRDGPSGDLYVPLMQAQMTVSEISALHALLALNAKKPELALDDIEISLELVSGLLCEPRRASSSVAMATMSVTDGAIYDGLALHAWNDAQLAGLQDALARIDFLAAYQSARRGDVLGQIIPGFAILKADPSRLEAGLGPLRKAEPELHIPFFHPTLWPVGWFDQEKAQFLEFYFELAECVDPAAHKVRPERADALVKHVTQRQNGVTARAPWNYFFLQNAAETGGGLQYYAEAQVWIDEVRIGCRLEQYRLAHGVYPASLGQLGETAHLPCDPFNGQSYHYRLEPKGKFLLYSVGWNQKDDKGSVIYKKEIPLPDLKQGDWVWPVPR